MELLRWIQSTFPPMVIAIVFPLVLIICLGLAFGGLITIKGRSIGGIYTLSLLTVPLVKQAMNLEWSTAAIIGGLWVPATLTTRSSHRVSGFLQGSSSPFRFSGFHFSNRLSNRIAKFGRGFLGAVVGSVLGLALGLVLSGFILALFVLFGFSSFALMDTTREQFINAVLNSNVYPFGGLGLVLGVAIGLEQLNLQRIHRRMLITAVIYSALAMRFVCKIFQLPFSRRSTFQVIERDNQLTLRCRSYRSTDWVWIGFNSLYNGFVLIISTIALWRGTWMIFGFGLILLVAIGSVWTMYSLTRLLNHTLITIDFTALSRRDIPLCLTCSLQISIHQIRQITVSRISAQSNLSRHFAPARYQVFAVMQNGNQILLLKRLETWEEAVFVKETIDQFLNHRF
jgi:hypothetical protein